MSKPQRPLSVAEARALIENPEAVNAVFYVTIFSLILTIFIGLYFTFSLGWLILPVGVSGVVIIVTYTNCLVAQINIAKARNAMDSDTMKGFAYRLDEINAVA